MSREELDSQRITNSNFNRWKPDSFQEMIGGALGKSSLPGPRVRRRGPRRAAVKVRRYMWAWPEAVNHLRSRRGTFRTPPSISAVVLSYYFYSSLMGRIGLSVFCLLKFSVAMCILLVKKLESMLFCVRVNIVSGDNYPTVPLVTDSLRNSMQKCGKILRGRKDTLVPVVSTLRGRAPPSPRRSDASTHCNFNAHKLISVTFGRDVAESMLSNGDLFSHLT